MNSMDPAKPKAYGEHFDPQPTFATGFPVNQHKTESSNWSTGLFDCFSDVRNCCLTCWCPAVTFGQIAEIIDEGSMTCTVSAALYAVIAATTGYACMYSCMYRTKMRNKYMLKERPCGDCLVHCCCECCALCQMYRELQNRGYNMQIGWQGNSQRPNSGIAITAPNVESTMSR